MGGLHVNIAVTDVQHTAVGLDAKARHQGARPLGGGLRGYVGQRTADDLKQVGVKVPRDHGAGKLVRLVREHRHPHPGGLQPGQQRRHTGVRRGLVVHVRAVDLIKLGQRRGQLLRAAAAGGAEPLHQLRDAVAHKIAVLRSFILRPAVGGADAVRGVGQVVNRVQQGSVQIKQYGFIHSSKPLCTRNHSYYSCI